MPKSIPSALVVLHSFGRYGRGDLIIDPEVVSAILAGGNSVLVVASTLPAAAVPKTLGLEH